MVYIYWQGDPILYTALFYEQYDVVRLLIEHGAEVNHRNKQVRNKFVLYITIHLLNFLENKNKNTYKVNESNTLFWFYLHNNTKLLI